MMNVYSAYKILHVSPSDSTIKIKKQYKKLVRQFHPDNFAYDAVTRKEAEEYLKTINEAYAMIKDAPLLPLKKSPPVDTPATSKYVPPKKPLPTNAYSWKFLRRQHQDILSS
jgi:DnaJ domain